MEQLLSYFLEINIYFDLFRRFCLEGNDAQAQNTQFQPPPQDFGAPGAPYGFQQPPQQPYQPPQQPYQPQFQEYKSIDF